MKKIIITCLFSIFFAAVSFGQDQFYDLPKIERGLLGTVVYSVFGLLMTLLAIKVIDWATPGNLFKQLAHEKNIALAIFTGAIVLGICIIIASAIAS